VVRDLGLIHLHQAAATTVGRNLREEGRAGKSPTDGGEIGERCRGAIHVDLRGRGMHCGGGGADHQEVSFGGVHQTCLQLLLCGGSCWLHHLHVRGSQVLSTALRHRGDRFHVAIFYNDAQDVATSQGFLH
uniref:Uncharacterized protein n=1 Tax=Aegilops tauschii subsp. strangulata TaxID=200361 RepID=A0A453JLP5_AEGTS